MMGLFRSDTKQFVYNCICVVPAIINKIAGRKKTSQVIKEPHKFAKNTTGHKNLIGR